jgi:SAM-dependent methyltransferase
MKRESRQKELFEDLIPGMITQVQHPWVKAYRRKFVFPHLFKDIELKGKHVLDAMCGTGQNSEYMIDQGAQVTGLDIAEEAMDAFRKRWPDHQAVCTSIFDSGLPDEHFDIVVITGGLHHVQPEINRAVDEVYRVLKPGGLFCFSEPHTGSLPNLFRRIWYKLDSRMEENERAVNLKKLRKENAHRFHFRYRRYYGSLGYILLVQGCFVGTSSRWQKRLAPVLTVFDHVMNAIPLKWTSCVVVEQWVKKQQA